MYKFNLILTILFIITFSNVIKAEEFDCNKLRGYAPVGYSHQLPEQFRFGENQIFRNIHNVSCATLTKQQEMRIQEVHWYPKCGKSVCVSRKVTRDRNGKCVLSDEVEYDTQGLAGKVTKSDKVTITHACTGINIYKKIATFGGLFNSCYEIDAYSAGQYSSKRVDDEKCKNDEHAREMAIDDGVRDPAPVQEKSQYYLNNQSENSVKQD